MPKSNNCKGWLKFSSSTACNKPIKQALQPTDHDIRKILTKQANHGQIFRSTAWTRSSLNSKVYQLGWRKPIIKTESILAI